MSDPYTRQAWNDIIGRVNALAIDPPGDTNCDPVSELDEVPPEHIWSMGDVGIVRSKLMEICEDNKFDVPLRLWAQDVIDEIEDAISNGWCNCEPDICSATPSSTIIRSQVITASYVVVPHFCYAPSPCPPPLEPEHFDYYSIGIAERSGFDEGIGGSMRIARVVLEEGESYNPFDLSYPVVYANSFDCSGNQTQPISEPVLDEEGYLYGSAIPTQQPTCLACTTFSGNRFIYWCACLPCWIGIPRCCSTAPEPPTGYPCLNPGPCTCETDEAYVREAYGVSDGGQTTYLFVLEKFVPGAWGDGLPCVKCCNDGIGFCGTDCPADEPPCGKPEIPPE